MLGWGFALDCATKTGWCVFDLYDGSIIESGVQDFSRKRGESNGLMFMKFRKWLKKMLTEAEACAPQGLKLVAYERAHFRGGAATELCVGMQTRVQELAAEIGIESAPVSTAELKKSFTGSGRANKDAMVEQAKKFLGRDPEDDNEADAVLVGQWCVRNHD